MGAAMSGRPELKEAIRGFHAKLLARPATIPLADLAALFAAFAVPFFADAVFAGADFGDADFGDADFADFDAGDFAVADFFTAAGAFFAAVFVAELVASAFDLDAAALPAAGAGGALRRGCDASTSRRSLSASSMPE